MAQRRNGAMAQRQEVAQGIAVKLRNILIRITTVIVWFINKLVSPPFFKEGWPGLMILKWLQFCIPGRGG
jgi:hypothetical protein